ncbi:hypothetical protein [Tropicimonas marinistellae]|uniref:hypothetical protein n=1 Tax=Tropicimonas marinistellae TaxID=1739787 RepID=UPI00122DF530|nr:hypothetical protein [Tropicimonas marinistellae]
MSDEVVIEAMVWENREPETEAERKDLEAGKEALREIDRLKIDGTYEIERARFAALVDPPSPTLARLIERVANGENSPFQNLLDGLDRNPDPEQRARFERLYQEGDFDHKTPREIWHILECLESAKKPKGRPSISPPWRNEVEHMDAMRLSIASGATVTVPEAARATAANESRVSAERPNDLAKLYRAKMKLRE